MAAMKTLDGPHQNLPKQVDDIDKKKIWTMEDSTTVGVSSQVITQRKLSELDRENISLSGTPNNIFRSGVDSTKSQKWGHLRTKHLRKTITETEKENSTNQQLWRDGRKPKSGQCLIKKTWS